MSGKQLHKNPCKKKHNCSSTGNKGRIHSRKKINWPIGWQKRHTQIHNHEKLSDSHLVLAAFHLVASHTHAEVRCNKEVRYQFIHMVSLHFHYNVEK